MNTTERRRPIARTVSQFLLLDLLRDKQARPVFFYVLATIFVGAVIYRWLEGWDWIDCFYFVVITTTTIGYGDLSPTSDVSKFVTIFFALNGVAILFMLFDQIRRVRTSAAKDRLLHREHSADNGKE